MRFLPVSIIFVFVMFVATGFANYLDLSVPAFAGPNGTMSVQGYYYLNNSSGFAGVNVSASGYANSSGTTGSGYFQFNISAPPGGGEYNITIPTNQSSVTKNISFFVTNISYGSVSFLTKKPPFAANDTFLVNITLLNATNGTVANYTPLVEVFKANGPVDSNWTIRNITNRQVHAGNITYNITVPSAADGTYLIAVERGIVHEVFIVKSSYMMAVTTQTSQNETRSDYSPGDGFIIIIKIRNSNGDPIGYATNVSAIVAQPNGTSNTTTLTNDTTREGYYTGSYTTSASQTGTYLISVSARVGSTNIDGGTAISTAQLKTKLQRNQDFFIEWGDAAAFPTGGEVGLNVVATNLSNNADFPGNMGVAADRADCLSVNNTLAIYYPNGTLASIATDIDANGFNMGRAVCRLRFTAPNTTGFYKITYNVTVNTTLSSGLRNVTASGIGYAQIERFALKPTAVSSFGGGMDFMTMLYPGDNATFDVGAYDMQGNREVSGVNITNIVVNKVIPLEFFSGSTDILEGAPNSPTYFNVTERINGTLIKNPRVTVQIPVNRTGPFQIEITAELNSSSGRYNVSGRAFYMAKYIMGFVASGGMMGGMGGGAEGGPAGGADNFKGASSCSGTQQFQGNVMDIASNSAPKDPVQFVNILQARDEMTGKDISSCLSMQQNSSDTTSGSGAIQFPVTFASSCGSLSGFYFMLINVSYKGRADAIPSGFMCQQLSFWVTGTDSMTGMGAWRVSPDATINFSVSSIIDLQNSTRVIRSGTFSLERAMNFNPSTGPKSMTVNGTISTLLRNGSAVIQLSPSNFSLTEWPSGFFDITWRVTANASDLSSGKTDTSWGGFQSSPFDAWINQIDIGAGPASPWGANPSAGQDVLLYIQASTNASRAYCRGGTLTCGNGTDGTGSARWENRSTTTGFIAKSGLPWEGKLTTLAVNYANLTSDSWNVGGDWGSEMWVVNVTIPSTTKKGQLMLSIDVNNSKGEKANAEVWVNVATYTVQIGSEEGMQMENNFNYRRWNGTEGNSGDIAQIAGKGWNLTNIKDSNNTFSKSGFVCLRRALNVTRYGMGQQDVNYSNDMEFLIVDNGTAGVYDTILIKPNSNPGNATYILRRGGRIPSIPDMYLWDIMDCSYVRWMNASYTPPGAQYGSWAGSYAKGTQFFVPYIIKRGIVPLPGTTVSVDSIIKQNDNFGSSAGGGGFGFDKKLGSTEFTSGLVNTDSKGVAFVPVTINTSGSFMMFWRINQSETVEDYASFKTKGPGSGGGDVGTQVQIRNFQTWATKLNRIGVNSEHAVAVVNLRKFTSTASSPPGSMTVFGFILNVSDTIFNGTFEQTAANVFVRGSPSANYSFLFNWTNATADNPYMLARNSTIADTDTDLTNSQSRDDNTYSIQIGGKSMSVGAIRNRDGENLSLAFYEDGDGGWYWIVNTTQNLSTRICAMSFTRPYTGIESATVYVYGETWGMGPQPTSVQFYWFDPINQSRYSFETKNVTAGPKGCAAIDITPVNGWAAGSNVNIKAIVKDQSGNAETTWVDSVWRQSQCSNGMDDDGDGKIDYNPWASNNDPGCSGWNDDSENTA